jgi:ABC-type amino acid transport substrate-binding protein
MFFNALKTSHPIDVKLFKDIKMTFVNQQRKKRFITSFTVFLLLLWLVGCGKNNEKIKEVYLIGENLRWQGLELMGKEKNLRGFNRDLLTAIGIATETHFKIFLADQTKIIQKLGANELDGILTTLEPNSIHQKNYLFSNPILLLGFVLITQSKEPMEGWNELRQKIIGITHDSSARLHLEKDSTVHLKFYDTDLQALSDLRASKIDGVICPLMPAHAYTKNLFPGSLKISSKPLDDEGTRMVALNNEKGKTLIEKFNQGLEQTIKDGTFRELIKQWGLVEAE